MTRARGRRHGARIEDALQRKAPGVNSSRREPVDARPSWMSVARIRGPALTVDGGKAHLETHRRKSQSQMGFRAPRRPRPALRAAHRGPATVPAGEGLAVQPGRVDVRPQVFAVSVDTPLEHIETPLEPVYADRRVGGAHHRQQVDHGRENIHAARIGETIPACRWMHARVAADSRRSHLAARRQGKERRRAVMPAQRSARGPTRIVPSGSSMRPGRLGAPSHSSSASSLVLPSTRRGCRRGSVRSSVPFRLLERDANPRRGSTR